MLHGNAGETRCLVRFCTNLCKSNVMRGEPFVSLAAAGTWLCELIEMSRTSPRRVEAPDQVLFLNAYMNFLSGYVSAGGKLVPKFHASVHMWRDHLRFHGNPKHTATWEDESENGIEAKVAAIAHPLTFALSVFQRIIAEERGFNISDDDDADE